MLLIGFPFVSRVTGSDLSVQISDLSWIRESEKQKKVNQGLCLQWPGLGEGREAWNNEASKAGNEEESPGGAGIELVTGLLHAGDS